MKELKNKAKGPQPGLKKAVKKKSATSKFAGCRCCCKCTDESAYTDAYALVGRDQADENNPHCGCNDTNTKNYAKEMNE